MAVTADLIPIGLGLLGKAALGQGPVFPPDVLSLQQAVEDGQDKGVFGKEDSSAGLLVQAVDDIAGGADIGGDMVEESDFGRLIAMGLHTLGLVDDD